MGRIALANRDLNSQLFRTKGFYRWTSVQAAIHGPFPRVSQSQIRRIQGEVVQRSLELCLRLPQVCAFSTPRLVEIY